jgi:hypothetical protein
MLSFYALMVVYEIPDTLALFIIVGLCSAIAGYIGGHYFPKTVLW